MKKIGIDVGGTFTDVILLDTNTAAIHIAKVPTTPAQPSEGVINGIRTVLAQADVPPSEIGVIGHGTTIATNLLVEHKGAKTGLITTRGFRDILEFRRTSRHDRADLYDMFFEEPTPLVQRRYRREVDERILATGEVQQRLDTEGLATQLRQLRDEGVEAVAVSFLHSYVNPEHERAALRVCAETLPGTFATASIDVNPEILEYERTSTTAINASLGPKCSSYFRDLNQRVRAIGINAGINLMQSNGGLTTLDQAAERPVFLLESGPAGGVTAAAQLCKQMGVPNAITGDVGGTTYDVSIIRGYEPEFRTSTQIHTHAVRAPTIDIESIGAGGGSIISIDVGKGLNVGPRSAGADPGPVCYGRGGARATLTDCNLLLGYIDAGVSLGGYRLNRDAAYRAVEEQVAAPLSMTVFEAALAVRAIANARMAEALRLVSVERGYDPRDFAYLPFGGGGPVHATQVARILGVPTVIVPQYPGLFSAFGMLVADLKYDFQAAVMSNVEDVDPDDLNRVFAGICRQAGERLSEANVEGMVIAVTRFAECRYLGQAENITVELPLGPITAGTLKQLAADFSAAHLTHWNFVMDAPVVLVNARARGVGQLGGHAEGRNALLTTGAPHPQGSREIMVGHEMLTVPTYERDLLPVGANLSGPAVIVEASTNTILFSGEIATVHATGAIVIAMEV